MRKRRDILFRFQPMADTPDSVVLDYLKSGVSPNELVLRAIRAYWLPFAYQATGVRNQAELAAAAQEAIFCLEGQIEQLRQAFGLKPEELVSYQQEVVSSRAVRRGLSKPSDGAWGAFSQAASLEFDASGL
ncbi:hypothetical protein [Coleofasciculus chthonoplastes]|uniref:hypothetical protein n=1 Tax=Coleofasciculus chthonoplastes TaxID=64178 RepID=UPI0002F98850|nr:hypothetical protein [Coleofasciculus chthonoplastes]